MNVWGQRTKGWIFFGSCQVGALFFEFVYVYGLWKQETSAIYVLVFAILFQLVSFAVWISIRNEATGYKSVRVPFRILAGLMAVMGMFFPVMIVWTEGFYGYINTLLEPDNKWLISSLSLGGFMGFITIFGYRPTTGL